MIALRSLLPVAVGAVWTEVLWIGVAGAALVLVADLAASRSPKAPAVDVEQLRADLEIADLERRWSA